MRPLVLALLLAACASDPTAAAPHDAMPIDVTPDVASVVDVAAVDVPAMDTGVDVAVADAGVDVAAVDVRAQDAGLDVAVVDVAADVARDVAPDAVTCGVPYILECLIDGVPNCVNITGGRVQPDGTTLHCGACGVTCRVGQVCSSLRCQTL